MSCACISSESFDLRRSIFCQYLQCLRDLEARADSVSMFAAREIARLGFNLNLDLER